MKKRISEVWKKVLHIGFDPSMDHLQQMRLFSLNGFLLIGIVLTILFVVIFTLAGSLKALQGLAIVPVIMLVLFLNSRRQLTAARFIFTYALMLIILGLALADRRT